MLSAPVLVAETGLGLKNMFDQHISHLWFWRDPCTTDFEYFRIKDRRNRGTLEHWNRFYTEDQTRVPRKIMAPVPHLRCSESASRNGAELCPMTAHLWGSQQARNGDAQMKPAGAREEVSGRTKWRRNGALSIIREYSSFLN